MEERHAAIDELDRGEHAYYRYDVSCGGQEILQAEAEIWHLIVDGARKHKAEDDRAIRRMLASLQCLDPTVHE